ncbi:hypothetical protein H5410_047831 [Solanum commersonii]|uniref:DUF4371 domain-containing protein n=1 Tax=Solanum commersonii TaxID=4109 RepID=A0A9J5XI41_SOLCO|nr:hypothetical protein H5410_047831 [Solanum commersonii]
MCQFRPTWFKRKSQWLEYSIKADAHFVCVVICSRMNLKVVEMLGDSFTRDGFRCWNKALERFKKHVGKVNSIHHKCFNRMQDLKNQRQSIQSSFDKQSEKARSDYRMRLNASIDVARFLLTSGFPFRGHDESEGSEYKGAFLELLKWYGDRSFDVGRVILGNAPQNDMMICPTIQKILWRLEQMALILRYVNKSGMVIEAILGNLFFAFGSLFMTSKIVVKDMMELREIHRQHQEDKLEELLKFGEVHTGARFESRTWPPTRVIRWRSHFKTLDNFLILFSSIVNVLKDMKRDCPYHLDRFAAENLLSKIHEFEFVFMLHLMFKVLLLTNELNKVLQKKDQDIVNAMGLLDLSKKRLQMMREDEWDSMMDEVSLFCGKHGISIPKMNEDYSNGKSKRKRSNISYLHHFRVEVFYAVIDLALQELNNRFDVVTSDLLLGMSSLSPVDSFANFHKDRIMKLAEYYPSEFGDKELRELNFQLDDFIVYGQKCDSKFLNLKGIKDLAKVMIETKLDQTWSLVYLLVKLTLIIHIAT